MTILLTGAAGRLGQVLAAAFAEQGRAVRLTDIAAWPGALPAGATFERADVADHAAMLRLAQGTRAIVHFGGIANEQAHDAVLHANVQGANAIFEAAKAVKARVVFASSNHAIGFHERSETLDEDCAYRPDGYYGLSKAYTELLGRLMFDKHGVESAHLRIGSCEPRPTNKRHLSTWLSYPDLVRLVSACVDVPVLGYRVVWGASANTRTWWTGRSWREIGYQPQDNAEDYAGTVDMSDMDPVSERYQGGSFTAMGYSR